MGLPIFVLHLFILALINLFKKYLGENVLARAKLMDKVSRLTLQGIFANLLSI